MRLAAAVNLVVVLCSGAVGAQSSPRAGAAEEVRLTGLYAFGDASISEPRTQVVEEPARCWGAHDSMSVQQHGAAITARLDWYGPVGGALRPLQRQEFEALTGTLEGRTLVLRGEHVVQFRPALLGERVAIPPEERQPVEYRLRVDDRGHLVGTRSLGARPPGSFWAVRTVPAKRVARCGAPPP